MKAKILSFIMVLICFASDSIGQPFERFYNNADSLESVLAHNSPRDKINNLIKIGQVYRAKNYSLSLKYFFHAYNLSLQENDTVNQIISLATIAHAYHTLNSFDSSNMFIAKAQELSNRINDKELKAFSNLYIGAYYANLRYFSITFSHYNMALELFRQSKNVDLAVLTLAYIGIIYSKVDETEKAKEYMQESIILSDNCRDKTLKPYIMLFLGTELQKLNDSVNAIKTFQESGEISKKIGYTYGIVNSLINQGNYYIDNKQLDTAMSLLKSAYVYLEKLDIPSELSIVCTKIAHIYELKGMSKEQFIYIRKAFDLRLIVGNNSMLASAYTNLGSVYMNLNMWNKAKENFDTAIMKLKNTIEYKLITYTYLKLADYYLKTGNSKSAYDNFKLAEIFKDSSRKHDNVIEVANFQFKFEIEKKQNEINQEIIDRNSERDKYLLAGIIGITLLGALFLRETKKNKRVTIKLNKKEFEQNSIINKQRNILGKEIVEKEHRQTKLRELLITEKEFNKLKSKFISIVSNEFRNPLKEIINSNQKLINEAKTNGFIDSTERYFDRIITVTNRLNSLMNDIFIVGRIDSGMFSFKPEKSDLIKIINEIVENHKRVNPGKRNINMQIDGTIRVVTLDPILINHAIENLLSNSEKFSKPDTDIDISVTFKEKQFCISVSDQGIGIPQNEIEKIFQPFYRASNCSNIDGTGLGLVIVKEFTELHKGEISFESSINNGTKITICIVDENIN